jgi:hypothetical protein
MSSLSNEMGFWLQAAVDLEIMKIMLILTRLLVHWMINRREYQVILNLDQISVFSIK